MNSLQLKAQNRTHDHVCVDCGKQFLHPDDLGGAVTARRGTCGMCGEQDSIIHIRHYNYLRKYYGPIEETEGDS